jgi:hypothetical protein
VTEGEFRKEGTTMWKTKPATDELMNCVRAIEASYIDEDVDSL